ncbi:MAG: GNAT family N-acetyltransferase [Syntrophomonadaceae bacterium]
MLLSPFTDLAELVAFLKRDYANNLYFFTYLDGCSIVDPQNRILVGKDNGEIVIAVLITPVHCSISSLNAAGIEQAADQMPPLSSLHLVGRSDYIQKLMSIGEGPERDPHEYTLCQLRAERAGYNPGETSQRASHAQLRELVDFYGNNDMLYDAKSRLPGILNWGRVHYVRHNDKIVSCALTTTETEDAAMIGAVYTEPEQRKQGYASSCLMGLCQGLIKEGKTPYLFYRTEDLALKGLYEALGFEKLGEWILATIRT